MVYISYKGNLLINAYAIFVSIIGNALVNTFISAIEYRKFAARRHGCGVYSGIMGDNIACYHTAMGFTAA